MNLLTRKPDSPTRPYRWPFAMREVIDNIIVTQTGAWAAYRLPRTLLRWRSDEERLAAITAEAGVWAELTQKGPRTVRRRTTYRPYPVADWAKQLVEGSPGALMNIEQGPSFADDMLAQQNLLNAAGVGERAVYAMVELTTATRGHMFVAFGPRTGTVNLDGVRAEVAWINGVLGAKGLGAVPATIREVEWLLHRSIGQGLPTPASVTAPWSDEQGQWEADDLYALIEGLQVTPCASDQAVRYDLRRAGTALHSFVSTVTIGRMAPLPVPDPRGTWLSLVDRVGIPYEAVDTVTLYPGSAIEGEVSGHLQKVRGQQSHYREHKLDPPAALDRTAAHALRAQDEATCGHEATAARAHGWYRISVSGRTEDEAVAAANEVIRAYRANNITAHLTPAQVRVQREMVPGEPVGYTAHKRRLPVLLHAAGMPQSATGLGDRRGPVFGYLAGATRLPVMIDPHYGPIVKDGPGLHVVCATQGGGKSCLLVLAFYTALKRGHQAVFLDPSDTAAGLIGLPELKGVVQHIDLARPKPGVLSPWLCVPDPNISAYKDTAEYQEAFDEAKQTRIELANEIALALLPGPIRRGEHTETLLAESIEQIGGFRGGNYFDVVRDLHGRAGSAAGFCTEERKFTDAEQDKRNAALLLAKALAKVFTTIRGRGFASISGEEDDDPAKAFLNNRALGTVITLGSPDVPDTTRRDEWSPAERMVMAQLAVAGWLTKRLAYGSGRAHPKVICMDETQVLEHLSSLRSLFAQLHRDARKWRLSVWKATQNPGDEIRQDIGNHVSAVFVGRIKDRETAAQALDLLRVPRDNGYEEVIASLSAPATDGTPPPYREFVLTDADGQTDRMVVDFGWCPQVLQAVRTDARKTPTALAVVDTAPVAAEHDTITPAIRPSWQPVGESA